MKKSPKKNETKNKGNSTKEKDTENKKEESKKNGNKSNNKDGQSKDEKDKKVTIVEKKKHTKFNLDFIYRREKYTLENLLDNSLISLIKRKISEKIKVDQKFLKFYYKEKELKEDSNKTNVFIMIKDDNAPFIDVKKELVTNQDIISLSTNGNLIYKVSCKPIPDYSDLVNKIEQFFKDICLEKNYLCEPTSSNSYDVCFSCSDHCFQFKRYMMNITRTDKKMYGKTKYVIVPVDKSKIIEPRIERTEEETDENSNKIEKIVVKNDKNQEIEIEYRKMKHREDDYFQKDFMNKGPYNYINEIKKKEEKDSKKKWISKKNFSAI